MIRLIAQRDREPIKASGVWRQTKSQQVIGPVETSAPDMPLGQFDVQLRRLRMPDQSEQRRASGNRKTRLHQNFVEGARLLFQRAARAFRPWLIPECGGPDQQRRPGPWPWPASP